jgi:Family of unknown function (DUF5947)
MSTSYLHHNNDGSSAAPLQALRRFAQKREPSPLPVEHCELCSEVIPEDHRHLLDLNNHTLICACQACSILFQEQGAGDGSYQLIPRRYLALPDFHMTDEQWDELMIPVNMVYVFRDSQENRVRAFYPSPAGATESLLALESWEELVSNNSILQELDPDVEALLINRVQDKHEHYIVPIDACYQLVGLIRSSWKGLSGGEEAWNAIAKFFEAIRNKSKPVIGEMP